MKQRWLHLSPILVLLVLIAVTFNWIYSYKKLTVSGDFVTSWMPDPEFESYRMGGWPFKYFIEFRPNPDVPLVVFDWINLAKNVAVWSVAFGVLVLYLWHRDRRMEKNDRRIINLTITDIFVWMMILAGFFVYMNSLRQETQRHETHATTIRSKGGGCILVSFVPAPLAVFEGSGIETLFLRIAAVRLLFPDDELLRTTLENDSIQALYLQGYKYDLRQLDGISHRPLLHTLAIGGRRFDTKAIAAIGKAKQLVKISLPQTNITEDGLRAWGDMPALQRLGLPHTDVQLKNETPLAFAKNVKSLILPRFAPGVEAIHRLKEWPLLEELSILGGNEFSNRTPLKLELADLANLKRVNLDVIQVFDVDAKRLGSDTVFAGAEANAERVSKAEYLPICPAIRSLRMEDCQFKKKIECDPFSFEFIQLVDVVPQSIAFRTNTQRTTNQRVLEAGISRLLKSIGEAQGLTSLDLDIRLSGFNNIVETDFEPLAKNKHIRSLGIQSHYLSDRQIESLTKMKQLQSIAFPSQYVSSQQMDKLIAKLPNLTQLLLNSERQRDLSVKNAEKLTRVFASREGYSFQLSNVLIRNAPLVSDFLAVTDPSNFVIIENAPKLTGLAMEVPVPPQFELKNVNFEYFSAGGMNLKDEVAQEVLKSDRLQCLTLAHCDLSEETLNKIADHEGIIDLCLTGTKVSSELPAKLAGLKQIRKLRVDNTGTKASDWLPVISASKSVVEFRGSGVDDAFVDALDDLKLLTSIGVYDSSLTGHQIQKITSIDGLNRLTFNDCLFDADASKALRDNAKKTWVILNLSGSTIRGSDLLGIVTGFPMGLNIDGIVTDEDVLPTITGLAINRRIDFEPRVVGSSTTTLSGVSYGLINPDVYVEGAGNQGQGGFPRGFVNPSPPPSMPTPKASRGFIDSVFRFFGTPDEEIEVELMNPEEK